MSPTWYTWLEQGRDIHASVEVLEAVCRVLQLDEHASRYVRQLAGKPVQESSASQHALDPAVECLLADLLPAPACAVTEAYDMVGWNTALAKVVGDPATIPSEQRNLIRMCFDNPAFRERVSSWSAVAESAIAELRVVAALHPHSDRLRQLIDQMKSSNVDFREAWDALNVRPFFGEIAVAFLPSGRLVGFGAVDRLVKAAARRPQLQERLVATIADELERQLAPRGLVVGARARQMCMEFTGTEAGAETVCTVARGELTGAVGRDLVLRLLG